MTAPQSAACFDSLLQGSFQTPLNYEFWPAVDPSSGKVLIVLHGRGDSPRGFHFLPGMLAIDTLNVLFLEAPDPYGSGFSWYGLPPHQGPGIVRTRAMIFKLLDDLRASGIKSHDTFLLGFSQGCLVSLDVVLRYPVRLGGVVAISGYVFFEEEYPTALAKCAPEQRIWVSHGFQDEVLPFDRTKQSIVRLQNFGLTLDWTPLHKGHTIDEVEEIPLIQDFLRTQLESN